jgi:diguanylate cyclase (GGDEF)-like protein
MPPSKGAYLEQNDLNRQLLDFLPTVVVLTDGKRIREANRAFLELTGYGDLPGFLAEHDCICELFEERAGYLSGEHGKWREELQENATEGKPSFAAIRTPSGAMGTFLVRAGELQTDLIAVSLEDVTAIEKAKAALQEANRSLEMQIQERTWELIETNEALERERTHLQEAQRIAKLGHWSYRSSDHTLEYAPQMLRIFGLQASKTHGPITFLRTIFRRDRRRVFELMRALQSGGKPASITVRILAGDRQRNIKIYARSYLDDSGRPYYYLGACQDITQMMTLEEHAYRDPLTRAYNRRKLTELLESGLEVAAKAIRPVGLVLLDVDHFKKVNDTLGHDVGDAVLIELADRVRSVISGDQVLCRWGGEEFMIALPGSDRDQAAAVAEKIRQVVGKKPFEHAGVITCSLGAIAYRPNEKLHEGIKRCDDALYSAKRTGRNRVVAG